VNAREPSDRNAVPGARRVFAYLLGHHPVVMAALLSAVIACGFFAWQLIDGTRHASHATEPVLEPWMSPLYVGRSWDLRKADIFRIMEIDGAVGRRAMPHTLADVMERTGLDLEELQRRVRTARGEGRRRVGGGEVRAPDSDPR